MSWAPQPPWSAHSAYYNPQHVYVPPQGYPPQGYWGGQAYSDAYGPRSPPVTVQQSSKYPTLNPILAADTTLLRFDIKKKPRSEILASTYYSNRHSPARSTPISHFRLISKSFPWTIDIASAANVTCEMVWDALWAGLQEPIADSEWGFIIRDKKHKETIDVAVRKRVEADPSADKRPKRIDYLGDSTLFKGLERDDDYEKLRLLPQTQAFADTWLVKLSS